METIRCINVGEIEALNYVGLREVEPAGLRGVRVPRMILNP